MIRVQRAEVTPIVSGYGTASAARRWEAVAEVQGRIVEIHPDLESGNAVGANELLVRIDDTDSQLLLGQRHADLDAAKAKLKELEAGHESDLRLLPLAQEQLRIAVRAEQRSLELRSKSATSESEVEQATSSRLVEEQAVQNIQRAISLYPSQLSSAKASIALAEARVREAERDIERTRIYSPFAGVFSGVDLEVGQFIGVHEPLFELQDDHQIEVAAHFSLEQLEKLLAGVCSADNRMIESADRVSNARLGNGIRGLPFTAQVVVRSGDYKRMWSGQPVRIAESLNEQSRTLGVVVQVINPPGLGTSGEHDGAGITPTIREEGVVSWTTALRPGTFCEVILQSRPCKGLITVPRSAMDGDTVYIVDNEKGCSISRR